MAATIYDLCWYEDEVVTLTDNESCIPDLNLTFLAKKSDMKQKMKQHARIVAN